MYSFGSGVLWGTPLQDALGAAVANPTPLMFGTMSDTELNFKFELKELYGQNQFAVAVGRGKATVEGSCKAANINAAMLETIVFGQSGASGLVAANNDTVGVLLTASVTVTAPQTGTFSADLGVIRVSDGRAFKRVAAVANANEYSVTTTGVYTFHANDVGAKAYINYRYTTSAVATARTITIKSLSMGYAPSWRSDLYTQYNGKSAILSLNKCVSDGIKMSFKNDDFTVPDMGWKCFADDSGVIGTLSVYE